jgi:SpoVK/Ycf46/Vps4 family AAA+-type ATPase
MVQRGHVHLVAGYGGLTRLLISGNRGTAISHEDICVADFVHEIAQTNSFEAAHWATIGLSSIYISNLCGICRKNGAIVASSEQLKALIRSHISRDDGHFYSVAMQVAAHEAKLGHGKLAEELRGLIDAAKTRLGQDGSGKLVPIASALQSGGKPRGELASLLTVSYPANRLSDMVLDDQASQQLARIIKEQRLLARIREHGLSPRRKLLLVGPPGTGKTMTASALAGELGIPLFLVRLDSLITKFMGETASKLRQVFDAIADIRGVYFFDEFDAIGSQRGAANDVGEIRRVLNSFLQMIEHDQSNSLIVAATNHPEVLDYALFRRFDDVLEYQLPTPAQALDLIRSRLGSFAPKPFKKDGLVEQAQGLSYAEICRAVDESIKDAIMHDQTKVQRAELGCALGERRLICTKLAQNNKHQSNNAGSSQR